MIVRSLASGIATCLAALALVACSPPAAGPAEVETEPQADESAQPQPEKRSAPSARRERRPDSSADAQAGGQYKYIDESGKVRLAARLEDIPERQRSTAAALSRAASQSRTRAPVDDVRASQSADVTIYTTPSCGYCRAAIAHFESKGIDYVNRDVESDEEARAEYLELTGGRRGVPVIVVGEAWIQGWSRPEFDRLLASSR